MLAPLMAYGPFAATAKARHDIIAGGGVALTAEQSAALYKARVDAEKARVEKERGILVDDIAAIEAKQAKIDSYKQSAVDARAAEAARLEQSLRNQGITVTGYDARGMPQYAFSPWATQTLAMGKQREALESAITARAEGQRVESEMRNALYKEYQEKNIAGRVSQLSFDIQTYFSPQQAKAVEAGFERAGVTSAAGRLQAGLPTAQVPFPLFFRGPPTIANKPVTWSPDVRQSLSPELQEGAVYVGPGNVPAHTVFPQAERYGPGWSRELSREALKSNIILSAGVASVLGAPLMGAAALAAGGARGAAGLGVALAGGTVAAGGARVVAEPLLESRGIRGTSRELALFPIELGAGIAGGYATSKFVSPRFLKSFEKTFLKGKIEEKLSFGEKDYIDMLIGPKQKAGVVGIEAIRTKVPKSVEFDFPFLGYEKGAGFVGTSAKFELKPAEIWFGKKYFRGAQRVSVTTPEEFLAMKKIGVAEPRLLSVEIFGKDFVKEKSIFGVPQKGGLPVGAEEWVRVTQKGKLDIKTRHFAQTGAVSLEQAEFVKYKTGPVMTEELISGDFVGMARKGKEIGFRQFGGPGEYKTFIETFATEKAATARIKGEVKIRGSIVEEELYRWREKAPFGIEVPVPKKGGYTPLRFTAPKESVWIDGKLVEITPKPTAKVLEFRKGLAAQYERESSEIGLRGSPWKTRTLAGAKEVNRYTALLEQDVHAILSPRKGVAAIGGTLPGKGISGEFFFEKGLVGKATLENAPLRFTILEESGIPKMPKGAGVANRQKDGLVQLQEQYRKENLAQAAAETQEVLQQEKLAKIQMETIKDILGVGAKAGPAILQATAYEVPGSYSELSRGLPRMAKTPVEQLWEKEYFFLFGAKAGPATQEDLTAKQLASMTGLPIENFMAPTTGTQLGIAGLPKEYFHPPQQPLRPEFVPAEGRKFGNVLGVSPRQQAAINESLGIGVSARTKTGVSQAQKEMLGFGQEVSPATAARNAQKEMQRLFGAQKVGPGQRVSVGERIDVASMLGVSTRINVAQKTKTAQRLAQPQRISLFEIAPPPPPPPVVPGGGIGWLPPIAPKVQSAKAFLKSIMPGYDVFVRREGKATRINPFPLVEESAKGMGAKVARETLARTFWIEPTERPGRRLPGIESAFKGEQFRRPKGKSRLPAGAFVEKSSYALDVSGEKRAIKAARLESLMGFFPLRKKKKLAWG